MSKIDKSKIDKMRMNGYYTEECWKQLAAELWEQWGPHGYWIAERSKQWPAYTHRKCCRCGWVNTKDAVIGRGAKAVPLKYCPSCGAKMDLEEVEKCE